MAAISSIAIKPADAESRPEGRFSRAPVQEALLVVGSGLAGDLKGGKHPERDLNMVFAAQIEQLRADGFDVTPGQLGEQLVIAGLDAGELQPGDRLRIGALASVEITKRRYPCKRLIDVQGKPKSLAQGRIGVMAKVLVGGDIRVGDDVQVVPASESASV